MRAIALTTLLISCPSLARAEMICYEGLCDEPHFVLIKEPPPPRRFTVSFSGGAGYSGMLNCFGGFAGSPLLKGDLRLSWLHADEDRGPGLRFTGLSTISRELTYQMIGAHYLYTISGFWFSPGIEIFNSGELGGQRSWTLPFGAFALGYDIPLATHLALRLESGFSTCVLLSNVQLGGALVARF